MGQANRFFIIIFILFMAAANLLSQNQVDIKLKQPPPNQMGVGDMWNITLTNTTKEDLKIYLTGTATEEKDGLIVEGKSKVFTVKPGKSNYKYNDFSNAEIKYNNSKYKEIMLRTGNAPEGTYTICVTAFDESGTEVGRENCIIQSVVQMGSITLLTPGNGEEIDPKMPIMFTWTPLPKGGPYSIKIVEIKGDQSPDVAIKQNRAIIEVNDIRTTTHHVAPSQVKVIVMGMKYAWQVTSGDVQSEVASFLVVSAVQNITESLCVDFENSNSTINWQSDHVSSKEIIKDPSDKVNSSNVLVLKDGSGGSIAWNDNDFGGNWLQRGQDGCFCFDYKVDYNPNADSYCDPSNRVSNVVKLVLYTGPSVTSETSYYGTTRAIYVANPDQPIIPDNVWGHYCLPIRLSSNGNLPTDGLGQWEIRQNGSIVTGTTACTIWDNLIQNVTGIVLLTDYNCEPSEIVSFDNFCWTCTPTTVGEICTDFEKFEVNSNYVSDIGNWRVYNSGSILHPANVQIISDATNGNVITAKDQSGATFLVNTSDYAGDWSKYCSFCFDLRLISDGGNYTPPLDVKNSIFIFQGLNVNALASPSSPPYNPNIGFEFLLNNTYNENTGWQNICLPLVPVGPTDPLPSNSWGYWRSYGSAIGSHATVQAAWNAILTQVDMIGFFVDCTSDNQSEVIGVDNICLRTECAPGTNPCNDFGATVLANSTQGGCCWAISLNHPENTEGIDRIRFRPNLIEGTEFVLPLITITQPTPPEWIFSSSPQSVTIRRRPDKLPMPSGNLNNVFQYCLSYTNIPQHVIVEWLNNQEEVICSDTIETTCDIPCVTIIEPTVECNGDDINVRFNIQNINSRGFEISKVDIIGITPSGITANPINVELPVSVPVGGTSTQPVSFTLNGANAGQEVCIRMLFTSPDGCCSCEDTLCIVIPECICNKVEAELIGEPINCCYNLSITNNYAPNYFTKIKLRTLGGVNFRNWSFTGLSDWGTSSVFPSNELPIDYCDITSCFIPAGNSSNIVNFCLDDYESTFPQKIVIEWMNNNEVVCSDTLVTPCQPPVPLTECVNIINEEITCLEDGTFKLNFTLRNNSNFTADGFALNPMSPSSLNFTPIEKIVNIPQSSLYNAEFIISGVNPGAEICFELALFKYQVDATGDISINPNTGEKIKGDCCYFDTCYTLPLCPGEPCNCGSWSSDQIWVETPDGSGPITCRTEFGNTAPGTGINMTFPTYSCNPTSCPPNYRWQINGPISNSGTSNVITNADFSQSGFYEVKMYAYCGENLCDSCWITFNVTEEPTECNCGQNVLGPLPYSINGVSQTPAVCGQTTINVSGLSSWLSFNPDPNTFRCLPISSTNCGPNFNWSITGPNGFNAQGSGPTWGFAGSFPQTGDYLLTVTPICGNVKCSPCIIKIRVEDQTGCDCKGGRWNIDKSRISYEIDKLKKDEPIKCDGDYTVNRGSSVTLNPQYICPKECGTASYSYRLNGGTMTSPQTTPFVITNINNTTDVMIYAWCGKTICDSCGFYFNTKGKKEKCDCNKDIFVVAKTPEDGSLKIRCKESKTFTLGTTVTLVPSNICEPAECLGNWEMMIYDAESGAYITTASGSGVNSYYDLVLSSNSGYRIVLTAVCGDTKCECEFWIRTKPGEKCDCKGWDQSKSMLYYIQDGHKNENDLKCGGEYRVDAGSSVTLNPVYTCDGSGCVPQYSYTLNGVDMGFKPSPYIISPVNVNTIVNIYAWCGDKICDSCVVGLNVGVDIPCKCSERNWTTEENIILFETNGQTRNVSCRGTIEVVENEAFTLTMPDYTCDPENCEVSYNWFLRRITSDIVQSGNGKQINYTFPNIGTGLHSLTFNPVCGGNVCDTCLIFIFVRPKPTDCKFEVGLDSITCSGTAPDGSPLFKIWAAINNLGSGMAYVHSVHGPGNTASASSTNLLPGMNHVQYTYSGQSAGNVCFTYWIMRAESILDTCKYTVCKDLPTCTTNGNNGSGSCNELYAGVNDKSNSSTIYSSANVYKWNVSSCLTLGFFPGSPHEVTTITVSGNDVYAGVNNKSTSSSTYSSANVYEWNGSSWLTLGFFPGSPHEVTAITVSGND
ncbi:MAG: hypothetical protein K8I03_05735, partial [Ignavibacteria bacterium]|nr:hypothetical protein [Ignavibacteria bacterium]